ncbi:MAG: hypothetical protein ACFFED_05910 [Candidatus Thorarchaeota archaeon]
MNEDYPIVDPKTMNQIWRKILPPEVTRWAIFKHGTIVLCHDNDKDPREHGLQVLKEWGPLAPGTPLGDFNVTLAGAVPGWVVEYAHEDIGSYVSPDELKDAEDDVLMIGLYGRAKRHEDFLSLEIIHVEDP